MIVYRFLRLQNVNFHLDRQKLIIVYWISDFFNVYAIVNLRLKDQMPMFLQQVSQKFKIKLNILIVFPAPSAPRNVRLLGVTDTTIQVSWWEPARANGLLQGYRIYFLHQVIIFSQINKFKFSTAMTVSRNFLKYFVDLSKPRDGHMCTECHKTRTPNFCLLILFGHKTHIISNFQNDKLGLPKMTRRRLG